MAKPARAPYSGPPLSGPGIFLSASRITNPILSDAAFNKWYNEVHIRDVLATGGVSRATRFREANPNAKSHYLALYTVPDLSVILSDEFKKIPMTHESLPEGRSIHEMVNFDTRFYSFVQVDPPSEGDEKRQEGKSDNHPTRSPCLEPTNMP
jgi:hypothetical protein